MKIPTMPQWFLYILLIVIIVIYFSFDNPKGFNSAINNIKDMMKQLERWINRQ